MPHNNSHSRHGASSGDDLGSTDEVKIFKDEGDREDEKISSENLLVEEKSSLIDLTESEEKSGKVTTRPDHSPVFSKVEPHASNFNMGYLVSPYTYSNPLTTPPPAHCGIPPYQLDPKTMGLTRPAIYPFPSTQYPYPMLSPDMSQVASWHTPSVYSAASGFRSSYPLPLPINTTLSSDFSFRFSPSLLPSVHTSPHHVLNSHPGILTAPPKQDINQDPNINHNRYSRKLETKNLDTSGRDPKDNINDKKNSHIKKPLNAFMLYMKEMRAKVVAECTLKESAAINQILGRRWHELSREEQSKYYEKARQERQLHMELYPGWSARDNYGYVTKKKKRKKDRSPADSGGNNMKKCRARFGLDQQNQWCKPCRRKKKCIRYMEALGGGGRSGSGAGDDDYDDRDQDLDDLDAQMSDGDAEGDDNGDDHLGSCDSVENAKSPDDDAESLNQSISSPGCLSGLSSLQSPTTSLASPLNSLNSPATPTTASVAAATTASIVVPNAVEHHQQQQQQHQKQMQILHEHHLSQHAAAAAVAAQQSMMQQQQHHHQILLNKQLNLQHQHQQLIQKQRQLQPQTAATALFGATNIAVSTTPSMATVSSLSPFSTSTSNVSIGGTLTSSTAMTTATPTAASFSDRMMLSLLNGSSLGNRFSNLAMGLGNNVDSNAQQPKKSQECSLTTADSAQLQKTSMLTSALSNVEPVTATTKASVVSAVTTASSSCSSKDTATLASAANPTASSSSASPVSSAASSPAAELFFEKSSAATRNPVGANPRDINNPLSINQLTKRGDSASASSPISSAPVSTNGGKPLGATNTTSSSVMQSPTHHYHLNQRMQQQHHQHQQQQPLPPPQQFQQFSPHSHPHSHHPRPHLQQTHHPLFGNNISQHFRLFSAAAAAAAAAAAVQIPTIGDHGAAAVHTHPYSHPSLTTTNDVTKSATAPSSATTNRQAPSVASAAASAATTSTAPETSAGDNVTISVT